MDLLSRFRQQMKELGFESRDAHLLLAVSGGVDSVVLAHLCKACGYSFSIAHCNFRLRDAESDGDEAFVSLLARRLGVSFISKGFDTGSYAAENKMGIQEAARVLRYDWFDRLLSEAEGPGSFSMLLTAHHADDNIETLLMNFFKGTGINGLQGIRIHSGRILRPLLFAFREEIMAYAGQNDLAFREDSSNLSNAYTRNYFRNELIPAVEKVFPQVRQNLQNNIRRFADIALIYREGLEKEKKKLLVPRGTEYHISIGRLSRVHALPTVLYEIMTDFGFGPGQAEEVMSLMKAGSGKQVVSSTHRVLNNRGWLIIAPVGTAAAQHFLLGSEDRTLAFGDHILTIEQLTSLGKISADKNVAQLDARHIHYPILLRKWKAGDYFYPLGMKKKKKLSRFLIDQKVSLIDKEDIWVLECDGKIIWVVGHRIDERFRISDKTGAVLRITCQ